MNEFFCVTKRVVLPLCKSKRQTANQDPLAELETLVTSSYNLYSLKFAE